MAVRSLDQLGHANNHLVRRRLEGRTGAAEAKFDDAFVQAALTQDAQAKAR